MSTETTRGNGGLWATVWMTLVAVGVIAGAGAYLDYRLEAFEDQLLARTEASQSAIQQEVKSEILKNRESSAEFASQFSDTIKEMSQLLSTTVESVSQHTTALASVIEKNEQDQSEVLKATLAELSEEIRAENKRLRTTLAQLSENLSEANSAIVSLASVQKSQGDKLDGMEARFVSLTEAAESLNETIAATVSRKTDALSGQLAALEKQSSTSLKAVQKQISDLSAGQSRIVEANTQTFSAINNNVREVRSAQVAWQERVASRKDESSARMAGIHDNLRTLADQMELGFASTSEQTDVLRSDIAQMGQTLSDRTEDLLVQLIHTKSEGEEERAAQSQKIGAALESIGAQTETSLQSLHANLRGFEKSLTSLKAMMVRSLDTLDSQSEEAGMVRAVLGELQGSLEHTQDQMDTFAELMPDEDSGSKAIGMADSSCWLSTLPSTGASGMVMTQGTK